MCMYYFCNYSFLFSDSIIPSRGTISGTRAMVHCDLPPLLLPLLLIIGPSNTQGVPGQHSSKTQIHKTYINFPSLFLLAPQNQIHNECHVTLFKDSSNTQNIYWAPCFCWPLKIKYARSIRSSFSKIPQIHKTCIEFPSLCSLALQNQIHTEYQVTLFKDSSNTQKIYWGPPCFRWPLKIKYTRTARSTLS